MQCTNLPQHHDADGIFNGSRALFLSFGQQLVSISAPQKCVPAIPVLRLSEGQRVSAPRPKEQHMHRLHKRTSVTPNQSRSQSDCVERKHRNTSAVAVMR